MLDRFVYGEVTRISPEAPIPVVKVARERAMLGGAGNVVRNLAALGAETAFVSVVGDDEAGRAIADALAALAGTTAHLVTAPGRPTTIKTRYIAGSQQLLRADRETDASIEVATAAAVVAHARAALPRVRVVVLSDYGKGALGASVVRPLIEAARAAGITLIVDPKAPDYALYRGASLLTPNRRELAEAARMAVDTDAAIVAAARSLIADHALERVLVTRSADGMSLVDARSAAHFAAEAREVYDVSGAGDTVVATLAAGLAAGLDAAEATRLANAAAAIVVGKIGTAVVYADDLASALRAAGRPADGAKTQALAPALDRIETWRRHGQRVGFTNGVFDLLHPGHVSLLAQARAACDRLVVGLNADASVKRLKGPTRPIQSEAERAAVLAALATVDLVVIFEDDTPIRLIEAIRPDVLVKGADYTIATVVGADLVRSYGGRVVLADLAAGHSTTATIERMGR
ncbi:MAG: D-glycero-beta-D-manno-heptose-7-phosphate kinase [Alphaproteobacteria bacterium]|nr:D-glycero-beta-D-manno-heptose-7-phosphate kinase [Alphaproteobacteria bacterium]